MKTASPKVWLLTSFILISILFYSLSYLFPGQRLWGFNHLAYVSPLFRWGWAVCGILSFIILALYSDGRLPDLGRRFVRALSTWPGVLVAAGAFLVAFVSLRVATIFLGDGYMILNSLEYFRGNPALEINPTFYMRAPLTSLFYVASSYGVSLLTDLDIADYLRILSYCSGVVFVVVALRFLKQWARDDYDLLLGGGLLLLNGGILLFFGYVENYAFTNVAALVYLVFSYRFLSGGGSLVPVVLSFSIATALHLSTGLLFPSLVYLIFLRLESRSGKRYLTPVRVWGLVGLSVVVMGVFYFAEGSYRTYGHLLHLVEGPGLTHYTLLSSYHLYDLVNEVFLITPLLPYTLVVVLLFGGRRILNLAPEKKTFLSLAVFYGLAFMFVGNPELGLARDWDAFATVGTILNFSMLIVLASLLVGPNERRFIAAASLGFGLWVVVPWIAVNAKEEPSLSRYERLIAKDAALILPTFAGYGYESLEGYYRRKGDRMNELFTLDRMSDYSRRPRYFIVMKYLLLQMEMEGEGTADSLLVRNIGKMRELSYELPTAQLTRVDSLFIVEYCDLLAWWAERGHRAEVLRYSAELADRFPAIPSVEACLTRLSFPEK
ncbi:MAG TPA: hypothetical protein VIH68_00445 [Bacteroidota bacterium]